MQSLRRWLEEKAKIAGFDKLAVTKAILPEEVGDRLSHFIAEDRQGDRGGRCGRRGRGHA